MRSVKFLRTAAIASAVAMAATMAAPQAAIAKDRVLSDIPDAGLPGTYAWAPVTVPATSAEADPRVNNSIIQQRITAAVDAGLAAKGYQRISDPSAAGMLVAYRIGVRDKSRIESNPATPWGYPYGASGCAFAGCFGGGFAWGPWGPPDMSVTQYDYTEGRLMIDLMNHKQPAELFWRVTHDETIDKNDGKEDEINKMIGKMLKKLPASNTPD